LLAHLLLLSSQLLLLLLARLSFPLSNGALRLSKALLLCCNGSLALVSSPGSICLLLTVICWLAVLLLPLWLACAVRICVCGTPGPVVQLVILTQPPVGHAQEHLLIQRHLTTLVLHLIGTTVHMQRTIMVRALLTLVWLRAVHML
jgi:hypothetical protein